MSEICRVCLGSGELISLFDTKDSISLCDKIMSCASVCIATDDDLPSNICVICADRLNTSYHFKLQCEDSDLLLRKRICSDNVSYPTNKNNVKIENSSSLQTFIKDELELSDYFDEFATSPSVHFYNDKDTRKKNLAKKKRKNKQNFLLDIALKPNPIEENIISYNCEELDAERKTVDMYNSVSNLDVEESPIFPTETKSKLVRRGRHKIIDKKCKTIKKPPQEQCFTCGKVMSSKFRLKMHLRIHTGEKPYSCKYCSKTFSLSQNLKVHERVHTGEKPLLCGICGKAFAQSAGLVTHMRLHTGETPYKCKFCVMSFRTPGHLQYHIGQHTGEKNYICDICPRRFITRADLTQHAKTHTGEKPFICTVCGIRMSRSSHLTRHMMTHTGEKPHKCDTCGNSYAQRGDLTKHNKKPCKISNTQLNPMPRDIIKSTPEITKENKNVDDITTHISNEKDIKITLNTPLKKKSLIQNACNVPSTSNE